MGEKSFTFFEIHLHDAKFNAPESGPRFFQRGPDEDEESEDDEGYSSIDVDDEETDESVESGTDAAAEDADESSRGVGGAAVVGLLLLVALAVAVKVLTGEDDLDELDDLSDIAVESDEGDEGESAALSEE
ncbi:hypothetical protein SAMN04487947_2189 [Halogeometricum rufum]|uniref:Uncharacterized protein n=1 Tax=Halogeometricum rufum TaxID=553469 RepID=A0A1I6HKZ4_9EURY|nr:hypothetical protein [Halogeometricum rufum]SFR55102.1 hypothetical protein SAMN04487947_2189 [Halogeometricum rufum]